MWKVPLRVMFPGISPPVPRKDATKGAAVTAETLDVVEDGEERVLQAAVGVAETAGLRDGEAARNEEDDGDDEVVVAG
ncbi:hypothetical protein PG987_005065 [Apiospora arundinis]